MRTEFVLIDFENVQPKDLALLTGGAFKIKVFLGAQQAKIPLPMAQALQAFGPDADYVRINGSGSNAVDFHIAYYIGRLAAAAPAAEFHVISKDKGFDPLIKHLREQGVSCRRSATIAAIAPTKPTMIGDRVHAVIEKLAKCKAAKPRTLVKLRKTIQTWFADKVAEIELDRIIEEMELRGFIRIADGKMHYELPA